MNKVFHSIILLITLLVQACASVHKHPPAQRSAPLAELQFNSEQLYRVKLHDGSTTPKLAADQLDVEQDTLIVKDRAGHKVAAYPARQIENIAAIEKTGRGKLVLKGLRWGALSGLLVGGALGIGAAADDCSGSEDVGDCKALRPLLIGVGVGAGTLLGSVIGLAIGGFLPNKPVLNITPIITKTSEATQIGLGMSRNF